MPSKRPERCKSGLSNDAVVLLDDIGCASLEHEVDFDLASSGDIAEKSLVIVSVLHNGGHGVAVTEVEPKKLVLGRRLNEHEWVHSVSLLATSSIVSGSFLAVSPHCPCSFAN